MILSDVRESVKVFTFLYRIPCGRWLTITEYTDSYFGDLLSSGAGGALLLKSDTGNPAHVITLWGVEYTERGKLAKLWVTESDDRSMEEYYDELFSIDVVTDANNRACFSEDGEIGYYELTAMQGISGIYIYGVSSICPSACACWQLVPEPATAALSLLALTGLLARRRR